MNTAVGLCTLQQIRCKDSDRFPFDLSIVAILMACLSLLLELSRTLHSIVFLEQNKQYARAIARVKAQLLEM